MSLTHSPATRRTGLRTRSALCLLAMLAAVSACKDSGGTVVEQQPGPTSQVQPQVVEPGPTSQVQPQVVEPGKSEPGLSERGGGKTGPGQGDNEPDENEPDENDGGGNEP